MVALYVVSATESVGKTTISAGLGRFFQADGKKVGYVKLLTDKAGAVSDTAFMKQILDLPEPVESLCPPDGDIKKVKEAYDKVAKDRDVVILEGILGSNPSDSYETAKALNAKVIVVADCTKPTAESMESYQGFGGELAGIVINKVPKSQLERAGETVSAQFSKSGLNILGLLPEDRVLLALTVGELADTIQGNILNSAEKSVELVENFMLGAMVVDSGLDYFNRKSNKAAIIRGDRPDMQLAALETSTKCLVLSSTSQPPVYNVMQKAENRGIPIISTESSADDIISSMEEALSKGRFNQEKKLPKLSEMVRQHINLQAVQ